MGASAHTFILDTAYFLFNNKISNRYDNRRLHLGLDFGRRGRERLFCRFQLLPPLPLAEEAHTAQTQTKRAERDTRHQIHVDVHVATQAVIYSRPGRRRNVWCVLYST